MSFEQFKYGVALDLTQELQKVCPVDTAWLKEHIKFEIKGNEITISMPEYWKYVEWSTKPHEIKPKNGKALAFEYTKGVGSRKNRLNAKMTKAQAGEMVVKSVKHPGTKANPFVRNTLYHKFQEIVNKNAAKYLNKSKAEVIIE